MRRTSLVLVAVAAVAACGSPPVDRSPTADPGRSPASPPALSPPDVVSASPEVASDAPRLPARAFAPAAVSAEPMGRIVIPSIDLDVPVYEGREALLDLGPLHWYGSARPGREGNAVFSAHRTTHPRPFLRIDELGPGDRITYRTGDGVHTYVVYRSFVVEEDDYSLLEHGRESITTIFACHPPGATDHWLVVQGRLAGTATPPPSPTARAPASPTPTSALLPLDRS